MKVLIITNSFPPKIDGVGDYTFHLHHHLSSIFETFVVCNYDPLISNFLSEKNLHNQVFPIISEWNLKSFLQIFKLAKDLNIDKLLLQYVPYSYDKYGIPWKLILFSLLSKIFRFKYSIYFHETSIRLFGYGIKSFFIGFLQRTIAFFLCLFSENIFTNTYFGQLLLSPFNSKVLFVPSNFEINIDKAESNNSNYNISEFKIVSFLNRCDDVLLSSILYLHKNINSQIRLILIGESSKKHRTETIQKIQLFDLNKVITIIDDKNPDRIAKELFNANLYIQIEKLFNKIEGGISTKSGLIMTAMYAGLPIISTRGDMTDSFFFRDKENLLLITQNTANLLCNNIICLLENSNMSKNIGINARNTYYKYASWKMHINILAKSL